jgi:hypothetical protein
MAGMAGMAALVLAALAAALALSLALALLPPRPMPAPACLTEIAHRSRYFSIQPLSVVVALRKEDGHLRKEGGCAFRHWSEDLKWSSSPFHLRCVLPQSGQVYPLVDFGISMWLLFRRCSRHWHHFLNVLPHSEQRNWPECCASCASFFAFFLATLDFLAEPATLAPALFFAPLLLLELMLLELLLLLLLLWLLPRDRSCAKYSPTLPTALKAW